MIPAVISWFFLARQAFDASNDQNIIRRYQMAKAKKAPRKKNPAARHNKKRLSKKKKMIKKNNPRKRKGRK